jgi:hypothetical protein
MIDQNLETYRGKNGVLLFSFIEFPLHHKSHKTIVRYFTKIPDINCLTGKIYLSTAVTLNNPSVPFSSAP